MAKKRRRKKNSKNGRKSIKSMARSWANKLASPVAFWSQLTEKDYQLLNATPEYQQLDYLGKLKVASNILTGSLTGKVLFNDQYNPSPNGQPRINPSGVINKWTGIGVAGKLYGAVGRQMKLPEAATIDKIGTKLIYGGAVGGFFDPPGNPGGYVSTRNVTPNVMTQNRATTARSFAVAQRNLSYDPSTESALR
jgi:hypothetical protein